MTDTAERAALCAATLESYFMGSEKPSSIQKVIDDMLLIGRRAEPEAIRDERIDALANAAILTDTQIRLAFAPENPKSRITALKKGVRQSDIDLLSVNCSRGNVHLQIKTGFGRERHIELTLPETLLIHELLDRFIAGLPLASGSTAIEEEGDAL